jgi:hypothetical protein
MITLDYSIEDVSTPNVTHLAEIMSSNRTTYLTCPEPNLIFSVRFAPTVFDIVSLVVRSPVRVAMTACLSSKLTESSTPLWNLTVKDDGRDVAVERLDCTTELKARGPFDMIRVDVRANSGNRGIMICCLQIQVKNAEQVKITPKSVKQTTPSTSFYSSGEKDRTMPPISRDIDLRPTELFPSPKHYNSSPPRNRLKEQYPGITPKAPSSCPPVHSNKTTEPSRWSPAEHAPPPLRPENSYNELLKGHIICPLLTDAKMIERVRRTCDVTGACYMEEPMEGAIILALDYNEDLMRFGAEFALLNVAWLFESFSLKKKLSQEDYVLRP